MILIVLEIKGTIMILGIRLLSRAKMTKENRQEDPPGVMEPMSTSLAPTLESCSPHTQ